MRQKSGKHAARKRPTTIPEYIRAAPRAGQPHLRRLYRILKRVAPEADAIIKWNQPFFVEPRFLFSFTAFKAHLAFAPSQSTLKAFRKELADYTTTKNYLKLRYDEPLPESLIRRIAEYRLKEVQDRGDDRFW
jgi:uncharacterized protein YdhG (YjbR/CyaY superfamily)